MDKKRQKMDSWRFDEWLRQENPFNRADGRLDLSYISFVTPIGLVSLAATCYALAQRGKQPTIFIDDNFDLFTYLDRAGFVTAVKPITVFEPAFLKPIYKYRFGSIDTLIEVTKLHTGTISEINDLMDQVLSGKVESVLAEKLDYNRNDAKDIAIAVSEVCQNVFEHNKENFTCGFIAMQVYEYKNIKKKFLEIGIADYGDGIAKTLKRSPKKFKISSHLDAILLATKYGVSEYDDVTRGSGLNYLLELVEKHKGTLQIRSGDVAVRYRMDRGEMTSHSGPWMPGVQISFMVGSKKA